MKMNNKRGKREREKAEEKKGEKVEKVTEKEEIKEIFEVEKEGKKETIIAHGEEELKESSGEQIKKENKVLRDIVIVMAAFVLIFLAVYSIIYFTKHFEYNGMKFEIVKEGQLTLYKTTLPVIYNGTNAKYNFYLRTDPRELKEATFFKGELIIRQDMVLNMTDEFNCNGDGIISVANFLNLYGVAGTKVIKDANASCDAAGRYVFLKIKKSNQTGIEQVGPACYNIYINDCEILEGTERYLLETLVKINNASKE
jgi:hypothetical protein